MELIPIDGAEGEGGGQILRTALTLAAATGQGFKVERIRARRTRPGLRPQHLAAVRAAAMACGAEVHGAFDGSPDLRFQPGAPAAGDFHFDIGTAGSTTLVLQTIVPVLAVAESPSRVEVVGGTHVPLSPGFHYLSRHWAAVVERLGLRAAFALGRAGFAPRGGGEARAQVSHWTRPASLDFSKRGALVALRGFAGQARVRSDAARRAADAARALFWEKRRLESDWDVAELQAASPGAFVQVEAVFENGRAAFAQLGERGLRGEILGERVARRLLRFLDDDDAAVDPWLADQLAVPLALCGGGGRATTSEVTSHLETVASVLRRFGVEARTFGRRGGPGGLVGWKLDDRAEAQPDIPDPALGLRADQPGLRPGRAGGAAGAVAGSGRLLGGPALALTSALPAGSKKARLARAFLRGGPVHCTWQLSPRCDALCHLCEHRATSSGDELDTSACAAVAAELGRRSSLLVSFTGSEPFLRGDLVEIVRATAAWHFPLLVTNGCLVTAARARDVWSAGLEVATVALEDGLAQRHDAATGLPGSHARALAALAALARERTRPSQGVNVRVRLRGADLGPLERALGVAEAHGASVTVEAAVPLPQLDAAEAAALVVGLRRLKRSHRSLRSAERDLASFGAALAGGVKGCVAGRAFFNVDHQGRISKCLEHRGPAHRVGSLPEDGVDRLMPLLRQRHARNECRDCWYASRAEVEGLYTLRGFLSGVATLVRA